MNLCRGALAPVALALLLGACAQFSPWLSSPPTPEGIDRLVASHQYGEALEALRNIPSDAPNAAVLRAKRLQVRAQAARYAARRLAAARKEEDAGNWHHAEEILREAIAHDPGAQDVQTTLHDLQARRARRVREIERGILIARGEWLSRVVPAREELKRITAYGVFDRIRLAELEFDQRKTAGKLLTSGTAAMRAGALDDAERCLVLSQTLDDTPLVRTALTKLTQLREEQLHQQELEQQRTREQDLRHQEARLHDQVQEAIADGKWHKAQTSLRELMKLDPNNRQLADLKTALDEAVAVRIQQLLDQGNALYREGRIEAAKTTWEAVLVLDPKQPQALANVQRAQRVLNKLRELKQQAPKTTPKPAPAPPAAAPGPAPAPTAKPAS